MIFRLNAIFVIGILTIGFSACTGSTTSENTAVLNSNSGNAANNAKANTNNPLAVTTPALEQTTNEAPTLTPVVRAFYDALKNKDDAALRKVLSQEFITSIEADMKEENRKGMAAYMAELDKIPEKPVEVRNEKIQGNRAVAEIKGGAYPNWTPFGFINENGTWKFTGGSPALENVSNSK